MRLGSTHDIAKSRDRNKMSEAAMQLKRTCQEFCVNGSSFPCAAGDFGRWESGNPGFGFPLSHRPQFFLVWVFIFLFGERSFFGAPPGSGSSSATRRSARESGSGMRFLFPLLPSSSCQRVLRNAVAQQNGETLQGGFPVLHRHGPLLSNVLQCQKE